MPQSEFRNLHIVLENSLSDTLLQLYPLHTILIIEMLDFHSINHIES